MNAAAIYADLSQHELHNVAARARLPVDDIRQEAQLLCWVIASGHSDYDSRLGSTRGYIMGRLWKLALREALAPHAVDFGPDEEDEHGEGAVLGAVDRLASPSVLEALIEAEDQRALEAAAEARDRQRRKTAADLPTTLLLAQRGVSHGTIAALTGVTRQAVRQKLARARGEG
ncbi:hypothetical protein THIX_30354 [Thiomonas sp. X19]|uniref:hypothetical protein n=1 Tax=Thiomonas sp. X19 TaxID=1050370 RepID=UPI000B6B3A25|nr:hypothetical protein [Thiomonas sp. X19]SCC93126.1 hypothetical protein THIX_30354 [Thiomonas sp. X19]